MVSYTIQDFVVPYNRLSPRFVMRVVNMEYVTPTARAALLPRQRYICKIIWQNIASTVFREVRNAHVHCVGTLSRSEDLVGSSTYSRNAEI